jgi:phosphohistidine swiveling domain-containing protein
METLKHIKREDLSLEGGRKMHMHFQYFVIKQYSIKNPEFPLEMDGVGYMKEFGAKWYFDTKVWKYGEQRLDNEINHPEILSKIEKMTDKTASEACRYFKEENFAKLSNQELAKALEKYYAYFQTILRAASTLRIFDRGVIQKVRNDKRYSNPDEVLRKISTNTRLGFNAQEEEAILNAVIEGRPAEEVFSEFAWITVGYYSEKPKTLEWYESKITSMSKSEAEEALKHLKEKTAHDISERESLIKDWNEEDKKMADIASLSTYLKDHYKFNVNKIIYFAEPLFIEIGKRLGISSEEVKDIWPEDTASYVESGVFDKSANDFKVNHNVLWVEDGEFHAVFGKETTEFYKTYLEEDHSGKKEFKGRVASLGNVKGKAVVITDTKDFGKMEQGKILVVVNTSPDYVPIMHMAKGIIAEEGGLTAHVSVVSREFRIPAIVGIKDICKVIKDGDEVELDTDKGIIKILN